MNIRNFPTADEAVAAARRDLGALLADVTSDHDVLLLVSGGSALALLSAAPADVAWSRVTLGLVDERYGAGDADRNDRAVAATVLAHAVIASGGAVIPFPHDAPDVATAAWRYESLLRAWHTAHSDGVVIATLGMGPDGHTAGIMPDTDEERFTAFFDDPAHWVVGYDATGRTPIPLRVTTSAAYLRTHVTHAVILATGATKVDAMRRLTATDGMTAITLAALPARLFHDFHDATLYTDLV